MSRCRSGDLLGPLPVADSRLLLALLRGAGSSRAPGPPAGRLGTAEDLARGCVCGISQSPRWCLRPGSGRPPPPGLPCQMGLRPLPGAGRHSTGRGAAGGRGRSVCWERGPRAPQGDRGRGSHMEYLSLLASPPPAGMPPARRHLPTRAPPSALAGPLAGASHTLLLARSGRPAAPRCLQRSPVPQQDHGPRPPAPAPSRQAAHA